MICISQESISKLNDHLKLFKITNIQLVLWLCTFVLSAKFSHSHAQGIIGIKNEEFFNVDELFLLDNEDNTLELTTSNGDKFTFEQLVRKTWPEKKIIKITREKYNLLDNIEERFYITIATRRIDVYLISNNRMTMGNIRRVEIERGKTEGLGVLFYIAINWKDIKEGILSERLIYSVQNLKLMLDNYKDNSVRNRGFYRLGDYKKYLTSNTLYLRQSKLSTNLRTDKALKKRYPYKFKIVSDEEWVEAIKNRTEGILYLDFVETDLYATCAMYVYEAKSQKLILGKYHCFSSNPINKSIFAKYLK